MKKFKVLKPFRLLDNAEIAGKGKDLVVDAVIELSEERYESVEKNLARFGGVFLEELGEQAESEPKLNIKEIRAKLEELKIDYPEKAKRPELEELLNSAGKEGQTGE